MISLRDADIIRVIGKSKNPRSGWARRSDIAGELLPIFSRGLVFAKLNRMVESGAIEVRNANTPEAEYRVK